jgi:hypothetical protein
VKLARRPLVRADVDAAVRGMPTASQKADKIERHERYKAKLAARESSQVVAFDAQAQATSKLRLAVFWREHGARFEQWWRAQADRAAATAAAAVSPPPQGRIGQVHALLLPELSPVWLAATGSEPAGDGSESREEAAWPPPPRGLLWLMRTRAAAASTNADDADDLAAVSAIFVDEEHDARRFPGLTEAQHADVFVGLGAGFSCATALGPRVLARGEEVEAVGAAKVEILMADLRGGQVARLLTAGDQPYSEPY